MMQKEVTRRSNNAIPGSRTRRPEAAARPSHAEIATRAFEIWCGKGRPDGTDRENWLEAERQLVGERSTRR